MNDIELEEILKKKMGFKELKDKSCYSCKYFEDNEEKGEICTLNKILEIELDDARDTTCDYWEEDNQ
jgi:hypothetical protein